MTASGFLIIARAKEKDYIIADRIRREGINILLRIFCITSLHNGKIISTRSATCRKFQSK